MFPNAKGSEALSILATIDPVSQGAGTVSTAWINVANFHAFMAVVQTGVMGASATLDAKVQQAQDGAGTGVKDVSGKAIVQIVKASGDNKQALINLQPEDVDNTNNFGFVRLSLTVGVAASLVSAQLVRVNPRYVASDAYNQAGVVPVIG
jgi:hypothetical protein